MSLYNSKYYLCIHINKSNLPIVKAINCEISEFGNTVDNPDLFERKLLEYGKAVFKANAISNCVKAFYNKWKFIYKDQQKTSSMWTGFLTSYLYK